MTINYAMWVFVPHRVSDASGSLEQTKEFEADAPGGKIPESQLDANDGKNQTLPST